MKFYIKIIIIFLSALMTSCIVINIAKRDTIKITKCSMHHVTLKKTLVRTHYGKTFRYTNTTLYPYMKRRAELGCLYPVWPIRRLAITLTCDSCTLLYKKWKVNRKEQGDF